MFRVPQPRKTFPADCLSLLGLQVSYLVAVLYVVVKSEYRQKKAIIVMGESPRGGNKANIK